VIQLYIEEQDLQTFLRQDDNYQGLQMLLYLGAKGDEPQISKVLEIFETIITSEDHVIQILKLDAFRLVYCNYEYWQNTSYQC
jgi:hypothetical protein